MRLVLRVALPDHPGALSRVTTALAGLEADIISLDVVARAEGTAVDDLCVVSGVGPSHLRQALEGLPGVVVEAIRGVERFRDVGAAVTLAAAVVDAGSPRMRLGTLLAGLPEALWATWALAVSSEDGALCVLGGAGGVPDVDGWPAPWLPLEAPHALGLADWAPVGRRAELARARVEVAVAPLGNPDRAVLVARVGGPRFRPAEAHALGRLAHIAARPLVSVSADPAATAGRS